MLSKHWDSIWNPKTHIKAEHSTGGGGRTGHRQVDSRGLLASQSSSNVSPGFSGKVYFNNEESNKGRQLTPASGIHLSACTLFWPNTLVFKVLRAFLIQDPVLVPTNLSLWLPLLPLCQCASSRHTTLSSVSTNASSRRSLSPSLHFLAYQRLHPVPSLSPSTGILRVRVVLMFNHGACVLVSSA